MIETEDYFPTPGYAYQSSMRHPANPETVLISQGECDECAFVGFATIDDSPCVAFKVVIDGRRRFVFQLRQNCKRVS